MLCDFYFDPILRNLQGDTHKEHKFDMILKCHILNSFNMKCVTTDRLKTAILEFFGPRPRQEKISTTQKLKKIFCSKNDIYLQIDPSNKIECL